MNEMPTLPRFIYAISSISGGDSTIGQWVEGDSAADLTAFDPGSDGLEMPPQQAIPDVQVQTMMQKIKRLFCCGCEKG